jgi:hypothetical protein
MVVRAIRHIQGIRKANFPGVLIMDASLDDATLVPYYMWIDSNGALRTHTALPTNQDGDGTVISASAASGATAALDNLVSVAINTALLPVSTVGAIDIGSSTKQFRTAYLGTTPLVSYGTTYKTTVAITEPAANRTITFGDPGGADSIAYLAAAQALTNKTVDGSLNTLSKIIAAQLYGTGGTLGQYLKCTGATSAPIWDWPGLLKLAQSQEIETGTYDITLASTTQTTGVTTLTIPDFASVADTFAFLTLAQTLLNKTLTSPTVGTSLILKNTTRNITLLWAEPASSARNVTFADPGANVNILYDTPAATQVVTYKSFKASTCVFVDQTDVTKRVLKDISGATTGKTMTLVFSHTDDRSVTFPNVTDTLVGKLTTDVLTNKTLSDTTTIIGAAADVSKAVKFSIGGTASRTQTLTFAGTANNAITFPDLTCTLIGLQTIKRTLTTLTGEGALTVAEAAYELNHVDAGAYTLAAPTTAQDGLTIILTTRSTFTHQITATGLLQDGTTGTHNTATSSAYIGATLTLMAVNAFWNVVANVGWTIA